MIFINAWKGYTTRIGGTHRGHKRIRHEDRIYVSGDVHTNTIEGFFGNLTNGIRGNYHSVSSKWLPGYLNEYAWRYNHRPLVYDGSMFEALIDKATP